MPEPRKVRMVRCVYVRENGGWVKLGRARSKCPRCGAVIYRSPNPDAAGKFYHYVELREVGDA